MVVEVLLLEEEEEMLDDSDEAMGVSEVAVDVVELVLLLTFELLDIVLGNIDNRSEEAVAAGDDDSDLVMLVDTDVVMVVEGTCSASALLVLACVVCGGCLCSGNGSTAGTERDELEAFSGNDGGFLLESRYRLKRIKRQLVNCVLTQKFQKR